jgi:hypothetical protein
MRSSPRRMAASLRRRRNGIRYWKPHARSLPRPRSSRPRSGTLWAMRKVFYSASETSATQRTDRFKRLRTTAGSAAVPHVISPDARTSKQSRSERSLPAASSVPPVLPHLQHEEKRRGVGGKLGRGWFRTSSFSSLPLSKTLSLSLLDAVVPPAALPSCLLPRPRLGTHNGLLTPDKASRLAATICALALDVVALQEIGRPSAETRAAFAVSGLSCIWFPPG